MKKKIYSTIILLSLAAPGVVLAAEESKTEVHGQVDIGIRGVDSNANSAYFQEFRDLDDGVFGSMLLDAIKGAYYLQLDAQNPGLDDQSFQFKGGHYGSFKYKFHYDEMPHNYSFDAITPFTGLGTKNITIVGTPADTTTWTKFDYAVDHKSYGGELELSLGTPFYVNVSAEKREQSGLRPYSIVTEHGFANRHYAEVPEPISNSTDNLHLKFGYFGESLSASISAALSSFDNDNKYFYRSDVPAVGADTDADKTNVLAPDNDYSKIAADMSWRGLPLNSVLAASLSYANLENNFTASDINYSAAMLAGLASLNRTSFDGDIDYTNASIALSSRPMDKLDTKIYYRYVERENNSSVISYDAAADETNNAKELLSYDKNSFGIDLDYRLPMKNKLEAGYEYMDIDRTTALPAWSSDPTIFRYDNPESNTDDTFYLGLKNSYLDWLTAKIKYTRLERDSDFDFTAAIANGDDPAKYTTRYDAQGKTMDEWKLAFDLYPMDNLDLGLDFTHQNIDYDWNNSSRTEEKQQSLYADITWRALEKATIRGFVGFENTEMDANKRADLNVDIDPDRVESTDDDFWTYGLAVNFMASEKLSFDLSWQYDDSDGSVDFTDLGSGPFVNISEFDDYTKKSLEVKGTYTIDPKLKVILGYLYEKLEYQDYTLAGYTNITGTVDYLSGLYADPNYESNLGYLMVSYGF